MLECSRLEFRYVKIFGSIAGSDSAERSCVFERRRGLKSIIWVDPGTMSSGPVKYGTP